MATKLAFTFPVFFHVAILGNTPRGRYKAVHNLICGFNPDDKGNGEVQEFIVANGIVTGYINGSRPISETLTSRYLGLSREAQINHIRLVGLQQPSLAANALVQLWKSGMIDMDQDDIERYLILSDTESTEEFLSDMLTLAIKHRVKQPLSASVRTMLVNLRDGVAADEGASLDAAEPTHVSGAEKESEAESLSQKPVNGRRQPVAAMTEHKSASPESALFASYTFRELDYTKDREEYRSDLIRLKSGEAILSDEDIRLSTDLFRRADRTFVLDFIGTLAGLADVLLHRVSPQQCLQLVVIAKMNSKGDFSRLRYMLAEVVRFALADDGQMFFANAYSPEVPAGEYNIRVVYSLRQVTDDEKLRLDLALFPPKSGSLTPSRKYRDRVPEFLLPYSADLNQTEFSDGDPEIAE